MKYGINGEFDEPEMESREGSVLTGRSDDDGVAASPERGGNGTPATMASANITGKMEADAVVFSIQFYGKTIGEVGLMDQDLSELDWKKFKSYLFQNLLSMNHQENICVSYSDDEGDKLPIESEEEYREALKIAKKKAEAHDKLVLDITRQGGLPTVLSLVSSGIKRVSSSPPKEGGASFFKASSLPKESSLGFSGRALGAERKLLPTFLSSERGYGSGRARSSESLEQKDNPQTPPQWFTDYMSKFREEMSQQVAAKVTELLQEHHSVSQSANAPQLTDTQVDDLQRKFSKCSLLSESLYGNLQSDQQKQEVHDTPDLNLPTPDSENILKKKERGSLRFFPSQRACSPQKAPASQRAPLKAPESPRALLQGYNIPASVKINVIPRQRAPPPQKAPPPPKAPPPQKAPAPPRAETETDSYEPDCPCKGDEVNFCAGRTSVLGKSVCGGKLKKLNDKAQIDCTGSKRKKLTREEERLTRKQEMLEERLARMDEKYIKLQEQLKEKHLKRQERITEKLNKQQEKGERKKTTAKHAEEMDKPTRKQEKVLAKMEGLRKKQSCSPGELSKLRKMVDKQHRVLTAEQRQQKRFERKVGNMRAGKAKRLSIDNKAFPVDASLLHAALQKLEALAEDSPSEGASLATQGFDARYVCDLTFPDGSEVAPGAEFVKTWKVINSGVRTWNDKTTLCKWTQVRFRASPALWKLQPASKKVVCPSLEPGQEGEISITFTAPSQPGWYATHWRFCQRGRVFGNQMWCAVHVVDAPNCDAALDVPREYNSGTVLPEAEPTTTLIYPDELSQREHDLIIEAMNKIIVEASTKSDGVEPEGATSAVPCSDSLADQDTYQVGIVEDYFDAEDPSPQQLIQGVQELTLMEDGNLAGAADSKDTDLISFEEEAELLASGSSTPEMIDTPPRSHTVSPLKAIAKESVESLRESLNAENGKRLDATESNACGVEVRSDSSESLSELDSEDQAILNESDSDASDYEYYVVHIPECFDLDHSYSDDIEGAFSAAIKEECERPDSPDFLTADEDDRTTAVLCASPHRYVDVQEEGPAPAKSSLLTVYSEASRTAPLMTSQENSQAAEGSDSAANKPSLPRPPPETKGFMEIPTEALKTNVACTVQDDKQSTSESEGVKHQQESTPVTWNSSAQDERKVVCEQPLSAQTQPKPVSGRGSVGERSGLDGIGALPDELVSIIPEDLVRGVWNTARTFITRINQEMLSPSANSPGRVYSTEESPEESHCPASEEQGNQGTQNPTTAPEVGAQNESAEGEVEMDKALQQLADMGFTNHEVNHCLLTKYNNDVARVVAELIVLNCQ